MNTPFPTSSALVLSDGQRIELGATNLIGRSPSCTAVFSGQKVSRQHAHIPFRCIMHHGTVGAGGSATMGEEPLSGTEVHYLFRVEQALERHVEIALTETAGRRLERFCPMLPLAEVPLKGFETMAVLFRPQWDLSAHLEI